MEHAQRDRHSFHCHRTLLSRLNPYFNGTCSKREYITIFTVINLFVLILILMEHAQRDGNSVCFTMVDGGVLILILMEHAQRARIKEARR